VWIDERQAAWGLLPRCFEFGLDGFSDSPIDDAVVDAQLSRMRVVSTIDRPHNRIVVAGDAVRLEQEISVGRLALAHILTAREKEDRAPIGNELINHFTLSTSEVLVWPSEYHQVNLVKRLSTQHILVICDSVVGFELPGELLEARGRRIFLAF